jgi:hypothetical protein
MTKRKGERERAREMAKEKMKGTGKRKLTREKGGKAKGVATGSTQNTQTA